MMNKKIFALSLFLCVACLLSGCSPLPRKPSTFAVKKFSKTYINDSVKPAGWKHTERDFSGKTYIYPMTDDHGIKFNVIVENSKIAFVEAYIPFLYSKYLYYSTDYKERIRAYHASEIEDVLKGAGITDYTLSERTFKIKITEDYSLEELATVIIALDDLLDYDYRNNTIRNESLGSNQYWDGGSTYDILIEQQGSDNELLLHESFLFSDNNHIALTHDLVLKTLELNQMMRSSGTELNIIRVNGEFYCDSGEVTQDEKTGSIDGSAHSTPDLVPKKDDLATFGSGTTDYQFAPDGTLYVFMSDGRHVFVKY